MTAAVGGHFYAANAAPTEVQPERGAQGPVEPEKGPAQPVVLVPLLGRTSARAEAPEPITLKGHTGEVWSVCFSPDGKRLASASDDKTVKVWDTQTGQESLTLKGHTAAVTSVCFSTDGKRLASASKDGTVKIWNAPSP